MAREHNVGAVSVGAHRKRGGWWKWLLLLLLLLAAVILLVSLLGGDDDDSGNAGGTTTAQSQSAASSSAAGTLTAAGTSLLPVPDDLSASVGEQAEGRGVKVLSVVEDEGFWVGTSRADRVYVEYGGDVGENEQASRPSVGDTVDLTGPVRPAPDDPGRTLRLEKADSDLVERQGAFINASSVEIA